MSTGIQQATHQSIKPFKSSEEYLYAMKEDLAEWLKDLYDIEIDVSNILGILETGSVLCFHANNVTRVAEEFIQNFGIVRQIQLPKNGVTFVNSAQRATFLARDNISNFINWCRQQMDIKGMVESLLGYRLPHEYYFGPLRQVVIACRCAALTGVCCNM